MRMNTLLYTASSIAMTLVILTSSISTMSAGGPKGKDFGFGLILGEPLGGTIKYWTNAENAFVVDIGRSYFGSPRIQVDYLWEFDAFKSNIVKMYAGPGVGFGLGREGYGLWYKSGKEHFYYREAGGVGVSVRAIFGINIVPRNTPLEIFVEAGPNIGIAPGFGAAFDAAVGIRFYP